MKEKRRNHAPLFKAKEALAAVRGDRTLAEVAEKFDVHPNPDTEMEEAIAWSGRAGLCQRQLSG